MIQTTEQLIDSDRLRRIEMNQQFEETRRLVAERKAKQSEDIYYPPHDNSSPRAFAVTVVVIALVCFFASRKKSPKV